MTRFRHADQGERSLEMLDDTQLETVIGGAREDYLSPQLALAAHPVGGWTMKDIWTRPTLGTYH